MVSFDLNFREKLWSISGGRDRAAAVIARIVENVDVLVGNEEDLQKGLGIPGPEAAASSKLDASAFLGMIGRVVERHPQIKIVATTLREVHSSNRHCWGAVAWIDGQTHVTQTCDLDVLDRVGGGDGFASGLFYGLLPGERRTSNIEYKKSEERRSEGQRAKGEGGKRRFQKQTPNTEHRTSNERRGKNGEGRK